MNNLHKIYNILGPWRTHYIIASLLLAVSSVLRMIEPKALQIAIDSLNAIHNNKSLPEGSDFFTKIFNQILLLLRGSEITKILMAAALTFILLSIIRAATWFWSGQLTAAATENAMRAFRNRLFKHIQLLSFTSLDKIPTSEIIQRATGDIGTVRTFVATQVTEVVQMVFFFVGAVWMMWSVDGLYTVIALVVVPIITFQAFIFFKKESVVWEAHEKEQDKLTAIVNENLNGIRVVQAFAREAYEIDKFTKQNQAKLAIALRHVNLHKWFWTISDGLIYTQMTISLVVGAYFTLTGRISMGEYAAFFTYSMTVTWPLRQVGRIVSQAGMTFVAMSRIDEILKAHEEVYEGENTLKQQSLLGDIEFKNVRFRYPNDEKWVLDDISFHVKAGEKVALLGGNGAGKSTIIALLSRFYEPTEGVILLDGKPLSSYNKTALRSKLGVVHQKAFLFSTSLKENIAFTNPELDFEHVQTVAQAAAVEHFIEKMPNGYDTVVGEKGVSLSGGQRQRVALARTLLQNPDIIILDDATSAVDTETESHIKEALNAAMAGKTTFIIAYRMTTIENVDTILVFEKGRIVQHGTHEALLTDETGFYRQMYEIQRSVETEIEAEMAAVIQV